MENFTNILNKYLYLLFLASILVLFSLSQDVSAEKYSEETISNAELYGSLPDISQVLISPNGKYVGVRQRTEETIIVKIIDLDKGELVHVHNFGKKGQIVDFFWATNERLIFSVVRNSTRVTVLMNYGQKVASNIDGSKTKLIAGYGSRPESMKGRRNKSKNDPSRRARIIHSLPKDPDHVLVNFYDNAGFSDLAKLNIFTSKVNFVAKSPVKYPNWITDKDGNLMGVYGSTLELDEEIFLYKPNLEEGSLESRTCLNTENNCYIPEIRKDNKKPEWVFFKSFSFPTTGTIVSFSKNNKILVTEYMEQNTLGIYEYDLKQNSYELLYRNDKVDVSCCRSSKDGAYKLTTNDGLPETLFLEGKNRAKDIEVQLVNAFPGMQTSLTSASRDYKRSVAWVGSDTNPGMYYIVDQETGKITPIGRYWSKTSYDDLAKMEVINYKASDGYSIQSYFTKAKNLKEAPTIVMPHGGPWARDYWEFSPEVQFLAAEGFNVLQINIRGSSGYGLSHMESVYGNFAEVLNDMFDGIEHYHEEGIFDKSNICIYGGSYGGYAATQGPMMRPDLFKCAVSEAGLYDINAQYKSGDIRWQRGGKTFLKKTFGDGKGAELMSPINYANKLKTPYFLIHGEMDIRTPYKEAVSFMKKLDKYGIEYEKMIIEKETHGFSKEENRIEKLKRVSNFFKKYLN